MGDRRRRQSVAPHDADGFVLDRHAERGVASSAGHLQVADIDSRRMLIHIQRGKGGRDRYVPLSPTLLTTLRVYYRWMRFFAFLNKWLTRIKRTETTSFLSTSPSL